MGEVRSKTVLRLYRRLLEISNEFDKSPLLKSLYTKPAFSSEEHPKADIFFSSIFPSNKQVYMEHKLVCWMGKYWRKKCQLLDVLHWKKQVLCIDFSIMVIYQTHSISLTIFCTISKLFYSELLPFFNFSRSCRVDIIFFFEQAPVPRSLSISFGLNNL